MYASDGFIISWSAPHPILGALSAVVPTVWTGPISGIDVYVSPVWTGPVICNITIDGVAVNLSLGLLDVLDDALSLSELVDGLQCGVNIAMFSYNEVEDNDDDDCPTKRMRLI